MTIRSSALRILLGAMAIAAAGLSPAPAFSQATVISPPVEEDPAVIALTDRVERQATWTRKAAWGEYEHFTRIGLDGPRIVLTVEETWAAERSHYSTETHISFDAGDIAAIDSGWIMPELPINAPKPPPEAAKPVLILRCRAGAPCIEEDFTHHQYPSASGKSRHA